MRSAAVLLACRAAGLAPSPARRHALALLGGAAPAAAAAAPSPPARDDLMYVPNMCELNAHMLLRELRAKGIAAGAVVAPDTFLYRQRGGAEDGRKGWGFHVFVAAGADVYDFESSLPWPTPGPAWVEDALRPGAGARRFRVVGGDGTSRARGPRARTLFLTEFVALSPKGPGGPRRGRARRAAAGGAIAPVGVANRRERPSAVTSVCRTISQGRGFGGSRAIG